MKIILVAAMAKHRVIGQGNQLPWHMPADLRHFKALTLTKPVLMGRKTYESIGRPLPHRRNIIISRQKAIDCPGCETAESLEKALALVRETAEICVIGGATIYELALPYATHLALTQIEADIPGDRFFPAWQSAEWQLLSEEKHGADSENPYDYTFLLLARRLSGRH